VLTHSPRNLRESAAFWLGTGAAVIVLGGIAIGATVPIAFSEERSPWTSGWFDFGFAVTGLGAFFLLWSMILYIAQRQTEERLWSESQWLRSTLRELKSDLLDAADRIDKSLETGRYWSNNGILRDRTWKKNRRKLSGLPRMGYLYDTLDLAFGYIRRINSLHFVRALNGSAVPSNDNLFTTVQAIREAVRAIESQLSELD
jgi:hypothetical protein